MRSGLVSIVHNLNRGLDLGGNPIGTGTGFVIGVGANPGRTDLDEEIRRFEFKVEAGAEYVVTQPVFDLRLLELFLRRIEHCRIPLIAGIYQMLIACQQTGQGAQISAPMGGYSSAVDVLEALGAQPAASP